MNRRGFASAIVLALLLLSPIAACGASSVPQDTTPCESERSSNITVPSDFSINYSIGPLHANCGGARLVTVTADGIVSVQKEKPGRRKSPNDPKDVEQYQVSDERVRAIYSRVMACRFFDLT